MKTDNPSTRFGVLTLMVLVAALSRIIPHAPNFTPVAAIALFGGAYFTNRLFAFAVPLVSMWISDLVINNTVYASYWNHFVWFQDNFYWSYGSFVLITCIGFFMLKKIKLSNIAVASISAAVLFFVISNFGSWIGNPVYPQNASGLMACYTAAIPFFGGTLAGDSFYTAVLFGVFELAQRRFPVLSLKV